MEATVSDFCPECGFTDFKVRVEEQIYLECVGCSFKASFPPPYPPNWKELYMTLSELVGTTKAYGFALFKILESGICPHCHVKWRPEDRRVEIMEGWGIEFPEENIRCPECGKNSGWASFMKLMWTAHPVREFLKNQNIFRIETEGGYEVYGKEAWKISFVADKRLDVYFDVEAFEPIWMKTDFDPVSKTTAAACE